MVRYAPPPNDPQMESRPIESFLRFPPERRCNSPTRKNPSIPNGKCNTIIFLGLDSSPLVSHGVQEAWIHVMLYLPTPTIWPSLPCFFDVIRVFVVYVEVFG